jgi:DNA-directed RNA polymerase specialized sigma24 family protein
MQPDNLRRRRNTNKSRLNAVYADWLANPNQETENALYREVLRFAKLKTGHLEYEFKIGTMNTADDFAQEIAIKVWKDRAEFSGNSESFYAWVHRIAYTTTADGFNNLESEIDGKARIFVEREDEDGEIQTEDNAELYKLPPPRTRVADPRARAILNFIQIQAGEDGRRIVEDTRRLFEKHAKLKFKKDKDEKEYVEPLAISFEKIREHLQLSRLAVEVWISRSDDKTLNEIAEEFDISPATVSRYLDDVEILLVENGYRHKTIRQVPKKRDEVPRLTRLMKHHESTPNPFVLAYLNQPPEHLDRRILVESVLGRSHADIIEAVGTSKSTYHRRESAIYNRLAKSSSDDAEVSE